ASVLYRAIDGKDHTHPFNMGVDFVGGTMATVKFNTRPDLDKLRRELEKQGIEGTKITLQPVGDEIGQAPKNEILLRLPVDVQTQAGVSDADIGKQKILASLVGFNQGDTSGKVDLNSVGSDKLKSDFMSRAGLDPQRAGELARLVVDYREKVGSGLINDIN